MERFLCDGNSERIDGPITIWNLEELAVRRWINWRKRQKDDARW